MRESEMAAVRRGSQFAEMGVLRECAGFMARCALGCRNGLRRVSEGNPATVALGIFQCGTLRTTEAVARPDVLAAVSTEIRRCPDGPGGGIHSRWRRHHGYVELTNSWQVLFLQSPGGRQIFSHGYGAGRRG